MDNGCWSMFPEEVGEPAIQTTLIMIKPDEGAKETLYPTTYLEEIRWKP